MEQNWFTSSPFCTKRTATYSVSVGNLAIGSRFPVRVQSMANTKTSKIEESVQQAIDIFNAGGELVRFTVTNSQDAESLKFIREKLTLLGFTAPIVADVHFNPNLADIAAQYVEKVRINPGNYLDKRASFENVVFTDSEYADELNRLETRFVSFLEICKKHKTAIRIGTNHGSLSDRIMSRYGDTPEGMVEATLEFLRICQKHDFKNVVVSLKSSNTRVMVYAYRLLALKMMGEKMQFPLHLGVTEAGSAEDGRIKSAVGIASLLHDGLGDTIRVSLTENPVNEIPVANVLINHFRNLENDSCIPGLTPAYLPYTFSKRFSYQNGAVGGAQLPIVVSRFDNLSIVTEEVFLNTSFTFNKASQSFNRGDLSPDVLYIGQSIVPNSIKTDAILLCDFSVWQADSPCFPLFSWNEYKTAPHKSPVQNWVWFSFTDAIEESFELLKNDKTVVLVLHSDKPGIYELRVLINVLMSQKIHNPFIIHKSYSGIGAADFQIISAADSGLFLIDGLADGLWIDADSLSPNLIADTAFGILQASRSRTTKTEYISCPSCGRTLFDIESSLAKVKKATQHLKGLKIAVMGCIVNGPGEMADADYGYVGAGPGKVSIYKGKTLVLRGVDAEQAVDELMKIISADKGL